MAPHATVATLRVLVVDDEELFLRTISRLPMDHSGVRFELRLARSVEAALRALDQPPPLDVVLFDVYLPEAHDAHRLIDRIAQRAPMPRLVAMSGKAGPEQAFEIGREGVVSAFFTKPALADLTSELLPVVAGAAFRYTPDIERLSRLHVGTTDMRELKRRVGDAMFSEALARAAGSKRGAARLLGVQRQALQQHDRRRRS